MHVSIYVHVAGHLLYWPDAFNTLVTQETIVGASSCGISSNLFPKNRVNSHSRLGCFPSTLFVNLVKLSYYREGIYFVEGMRREIYIHVGRIKLYNESSSIVGDRDVQNLCRRRIIDTLHEQIHCCRDSLLCFGCEVPSIVKTGVYNS